MKLNKSGENFIFALFFSIIITSILHFIAVQNFETYILKNGFFYDPVLFYDYFINIYHKYIDELNLYHKDIPSRANLILYEFKNNYYFPLRTSLTILFFPNFMNSIHAHLFWEIPIFFCTCFLFIYTLRKYSNLLNALFFSSIFFFSPSFIDGKYGLDVFWLDTAPAFSLLSALICLVNWNLTNKKLWLLFCGLFISIAIMNRYIFCVWSFFTITPLLLFYLNQKFKFKFENYIKPLLILLIGIGVGLPYMIINYKFFFNYYTVMGDGYTIGITIHKSFWSFVEFIKKVLTLQYFLFLTFVILSIIYINRIKNKEVWVTLVSCITIPFFLIFVIKGAYNFHVFHTTFIIFGIFLMIIGTKYPIKKNILIPVFCLFFISNYLIYMRKSTCESPDDHSKKNYLNIKKYESETINIISSLEKNKSTSIFSTLKENHNCFLNVEYFIKTKQFLQENVKNCFYTNDFLWNLYYKNKTASEISDLLYETCLSRKYFIDYQYIDKRVGNIYYNNKTFQIYLTLTDKIKKSGTFRQKCIIKSDDLPPVIIYDNFNFKNIDTVSIN